MNDPQEDVVDQPLDPWVLDMARSAVDELDADVEVPRAMMWARIERQRRAGLDATGQPLEATPATGVRRLSFRVRQVAAIAAVLVGGVAIGRYVVPASSNAGMRPADTVAAVEGVSASSTDPSRVAMQEHLAHTVSLLTEVRDGDPASVTTADIGPQARGLLATTRLLLDQPQLRDSTTRRLLQDLELVLVQVVQARGSAPETQRAPQETLKETNLLPRVRALVTSSSRDGFVYGGN